jgi:hypothetical protein
MEAGRVQVLIFIAFRAIRRNHRHIRIRRGVHGATPLMPIWSKKAYACPPFYSFGAMYAGFTDGMYK